MVWVIVLLPTAEWGPRFPLVIAGALLLTWAFVSVRRLVWILRARGGFLIVTPRLLVMADLAGIHTEPVWNFTQCAARRAPGGLELHFHFGTKTLAVPYHPSQKARAERFVTTLMVLAEVSRRLLEKVPAAERIQSGNWSEWEDSDPFPDVPDGVKYGSPSSEAREPLKRRITSRWTEFAALAVATVALLFTVPTIIDANAFQKAAVLDTATSYRAYLQVGENVRHRTTARSRLAALYDREIAAYLARSGSASGASGFAEMLRYMRDHDVYAVPLTFESKSQVVDLPVSGYKIISVAPHFTPERNRAREQVVVAGVRKTISTLFPNDILQIAEQSSDGPRIAVNYTYANQLGSRYYFVREESLPESRRTWFYGIEVNWELSLYVPTQTTPVHRFVLTSVPAMTITIGRDETPENVYNLMAKSAFDDFDSAFRAEFFGKAK
jgi:hypothetical protein